MKDPAVAFNKDHAASYDDRFARIAPLRDALHLLIHILLSDLPDRARILCVGAGTGSELLALAQAFPHARFTAVEPSDSMLDICRQRANEAGVASRCTFHHGYIHDLPPCEPFDAATSLLVSQFILKRTERVAFFAEIAARLCPRGFLINSDLSSDLDSEDSKGLKTYWHKMLLHTGAPVAQARNYLNAWKSGVAVLPPHQIAEMISTAGFESPTLFYQSLFIHAWCARRRE